MGLNCPQDQTIIEIMFLLEISPFCWFFFWCGGGGEGKWSGREVEGKGMYKNRGTRSFRNSPNSAIPVPTRFN